MKKSHVIVILLIIIIPLCLYMFPNKNSTKLELTNGNLVIDKVEEIKIIALPSPPKFKTINKKQDLIRITEFLNSINYRQSKQENTKGWEIRLIVKGKEEHSIAFVGQKVKFNDTWYNVNKSVRNELRELYNSP